MEFCSCFIGKRSQDHSWLQQGWASIFPGVGHIAGPGKAGFYSKATKSACHRRPQPAPHPPPSPGKQWCLTSLHSHFLFSHQCICITTLISPILKKEENALVPEPWKIQEKIEGKMIDNLSHTPEIRTNVNIMECFLPAVFHTYINATIWYFYYWATRFSLIVYCVSLCH